MLKNIRVLSYLFSSHSLETVFARVRISNDPEFRFPQKLWCLLYKSPSEIQDISLKWSIHFFSPTPFLMKWSSLVRMIVGNLTIITISIDRQYIGRPSLFLWCPILIMIVRVFCDRTGLTNLWSWSWKPNKIVIMIVNVFSKYGMLIRQ